MSDRDPKTVAEAVAFVDRYIKQGCGDHSCAFVTPTGMGTNGGCRCKDRPGVVGALAVLLKVARAAPPPSATAAPGDVRCHKCGLRGRDHDVLGGHAFDPAAPAEEEKCPGCGGRGRITRSETWEERCPACGGSGRAPSRGEVR